MAENIRIMLADLAHSYSVHNHSLPVPLGIGYLKSYCLDQHPEGVTIELFKHPEQLLSAAMATPPDILGFANYGWNENLNLKVGSYLRSRFPNMTIVAGGPNIDQAADQRLAFLARHAYLDYLVIDGGEEPLAEFITWYVNTPEDRTRLPENFAWREGGVLFTTPERSQSNKKIEGIPSPYLAGYLDKFLDMGMVPLFESNRGCPFKCTFCAWGSASKDLVRQFELETILAEVEYVGRRTAARNWIFCDANFGMLKRDVEIAKAIRRVRETTGYPKTCHIWLSKNTTERNFEIGEILGDMTVPVMAVQSLNEPTLKAVNRSNISSETYFSYQQQFHKIGSRTYSDMIVPLPEETLSSHLDGLRTMLQLGVDVIANHNMRMLAGAESNSAETRAKYQFRTRYRIIHGDAGRYSTPDNEHIDSFEYEESLRETATFSESDLLYLRQLHFLVDFCWNSRVYRPVMNLLASEGINPLDIFVDLLELSCGQEEHSNTSLARVQQFFEHFERDSKGEWFDSRSEIERYFAEPENFNRLINQDFDKLNILYSIILLKEYKLDFDQVIRQIINKHSVQASGLLNECMGISFLIFPPISTESCIVETSISSTACSFFGAIKLAADAVAATGDELKMRKISLTPNPDRDRLIAIISETQGASISKILNTQGYRIDDLGFDIQLLAT